MKNLEKHLINKGYYKFKLQQKYFNTIHLELSKIISKEIGTEITNLNSVHKYIKKEKLNSIRLKIFRFINKNKFLKEVIYLSSKNEIEESIGNENCSSDINFSIQLPKDESSTLDMHTDFFSGESLFQINLWMPFENTKKTSSMFIINPKKSLEILKKIKSGSANDFNIIKKKYKKFMKWIDFKKGEAMIFSPNCLHGNVMNQETNTRLSINIRYKNLYSPYGNLDNEKKIGLFYKPFQIKAVSKFNLKYDFDEIIKK